MKQSWAIVAERSFSHQVLQQLRCLADQSTFQHLVLTFVLSRINYCNSVLVDLTQSSLALLQRVYHAAVHLVAGLGLYNHITDSMKDLYWPPAQYRIKFKLCVTMHQRCQPTIHQGSFDNDQKDVRMVPPPFSCGRGSRTPKFKSECGHHTFSGEGSLKWNVLPANVRNMKDKISFKNVLKTHLFKLAHNCQSIQMTITK